MVYNNLIKGKREHNLIDWPDVMKSKFGDRHFFYHIKRLYKIWHVMNSTENETNRIKVKCHFLHLHLNLKQPRNDHVSKKAGYFNRCVSSCE